ncbi:hypothetical protein BR93DRAFT_502541 [Coniochaeta sp. PMI_546]|nr:hypothetical protein BR93DRAFT_502541 [Coniochaeta sp. PMI_546]
MIIARNMHMLPSSKESLNICFFLVFLWRHKVAALNLLPSHSLISCPQCSKRVGNRGGRRRMLKLVRRGRCCERIRMKVSATKWRIPLDSVRYVEHYFVVTVQSRGNIWTIGGRSSS